MTIYLDFDGTVVEHAYPEIGLPVPEAERVVKELMCKHIVVLNTMRSNFRDGTEWHAIDYLRDAEINLALHTVRKLHPNPFDGSRSDFLFIDDAQDGVPLIPDSRGHLMVDWLKVEQALQQWGIL